MRAIAFTQPGGPDVLSVHDLPEPHAGPGEVRVRVRAATINPTDVVVRTGQRLTGPSPWGLAAHPAGEIDEVGEGAGYSIGDRVMLVTFPDGSHGAYAEHVVVDARSVAQSRTRSTSRAPPRSP